MTVRPTNLSLAEGVLWIEWSDGQTRMYDVGELRGRCPCATCDTERMRAEGARLDPAGSDVGIRQMLPVGEYAYKIRFTDGHDTGIFPLELLRRLGRVK